MSGRLAGKVALITGTGGGQGRLAALRFAEEGAIVVGCDVQQAGSEETVRLVREAGYEMTASAPVDLGDPDGARGWVEAAAELHGRIDVLYNNASAARFGPIETFSDEDWRFTMRNEIDLVFYATRAAWPHLRESHGVILNTGSLAGLAGQRDTPQLAHAATKGAVISMTRQMAAEGAVDGIRAVCISPGAIETPGTADFFSKPEVRAALLAPQLVQRVGQPTDVIELAVHLASDAASFITGANFVVDGGVSAI
jgi:NAD(P)-dependent dehydrogenase (short-subunit alcohol dehydrogenase family)